MIRRQFNDLAWTLVFILALVFIAVLTLRGESFQRFVRVGYSDLRDNRTSVHVIKDNDTGQCRAYVAMQNTYSGYAANALSISDTWPVPCSYLDVTPSLPPPSMSPIR